MSKIPHSLVNFNDWTTNQMIDHAARNRFTKHTQNNDNNNNNVFRPGPGPKLLPKFKKTCVDKGDLIHDRSRKKTHLTRFLESLHTDNEEHKSLSY